MLLRCGVSLQSICFVTFIQLPFFLSYPSLLRPPSPCHVFLLMCSMIFLPISYLDDSILPPRSRRASSYIYNIIVYLFLYTLGAPHRPSSPVIPVYMRRQFLLHPSCSL